jgi:hypothetical protein
MIRTRGPSAGTQARGGFVRRVRHSQAAKIAVPRSVLPCCNTWSVRCSSDSASASTPSCVNASQARCVAIPSTIEIVTARHDAAGRPGQVHAPSRSARRLGSSASIGCLKIRWNAAYANTPAGRQNHSSPRTSWLDSRASAGTKYQASGITLPIARAEGTALTPSSLASGMTAAGWANAYGTACHGIGHA